MISIISPYAAELQDEHDTVRAAGTPLVTVIVPVRNEARHIERTLSHLVSQDYNRQRFEILVIDGDSSDDTPRLVEAFARSHPEVRLLHNPRRWSSAARNIGVRHARGDLLVIVDGHCELEDDQYLNHLVAAFENSSADCVGRPQPLRSGEATALHEAIAAARSSRLGHHPDSYVFSSKEGFVPARSVAVAYRREVFEQVGLFDESFDACEDVEFNYRVEQAGMRCFFTPRVAVRYRPRDSLPGLFRQMARYGRGRIRLLRKHRETASLRTLLPMLLVFGVLVGLGLSVLDARFLPFYLGGAVIYALTIVLASLSIAFVRRKPSLVPRLILVFAAIHFGAGTGMLRELCYPFRIKASAR